MIKIIYDNVTKELSPTQSRCFYGLQVLLGTLYIALLSQVEIPLRPIPITLHTFSIFTLALYLGKNRATFSAISYLAAATMGLPVFPNFTSAPFWLLDPSAGFCLSFPFAAYIIGYFSESKSQISLARTTLSVFAGQLVIYFFGISWLSCFIGFNEALVIGLYPFIPMAVMKLAAAVSMKMTTKHLGSLL